MLLVGKSTINGVYTKYIYIYIICWMYIPHIYKCVDVCNGLSCTESIAVGSSKVYMPLYTICLHIVFIQLIYICHTIVISYIYAIVYIPRIFYIYLYIPLLFLVPALMFGKFPACVGPRPTFVYPLP